jgi:hypothetical protein
MVSGIKGNDLVRGECATQRFVFEVKRSHARDARKEHCGNQQYE